MFRINSFLFGVKLESFGLWIGWFEYGTSVFVAFGSIIAAMFLVKDAIASDSIVRGLIQLNIFEMKLKSQFVFQG